MLRGHSTKCSAQMSRLCISSLCLYLNPALPFSTLLNPAFVTLLGEDTPS